jgi:hypothetical protein
LGLEKAVEPLGLDLEKAVGPQNWTKAVESSSSNSEKAVKHKT